MGRKILQKAWEDAETVIKPTHGEVPNDISLPDRCMECRRFEGCGTPFMDRSGPPNPDVLIVGEAAGETEDRAGVQFIGRSGQLLRAALDESGLSMLKVGFVNALRCGTTTPTKQEIELCRPFLFQEFTSLNPKVIILLGGVATYAVLDKKKITEMKGKEVFLDDRIFLPIFHPSYILRKRIMYRGFVEDLKHALAIVDEVESGKRTKKLRKRYKVIETIEEFDEYMEYLEQADLLFYDTEFEPLEWLFTETRLLTTNFSANTHEAGVIPIDHFESPFQNNQYVKDRIANLLRTKRLGMHFAEADTIISEKTLGVKVEEMNVVIDTMTASMAVSGIAASHKLKNLAYSYADTGGYELELEKFKHEHDIVNYGDIPLKTLCSPYAGADTDTTAQAAEKLLVKLKQTDQMFYYKNVLRGGYKLNIELRRNGLLLDQDEIKKRIEFFDAEEARVLADIRKIPAIDKFARMQEAQKKTFSLRSPVQMPALLFTALGVAPSGDLTDKGKPSLKATSCKKMLFDPNTSPEGAAVLKAIVRMGKVKTFKGTFLTGYLKHMWDDGRLHARFRNAAMSGRRRVERPNVQNTPSGRNVPFDGPKREHPWNMRMTVKSTDGFSFLYPDYEQIEFRIAASYSKDPNMIAGCNPKPNDAHTRIAKKYDISRDPFAKIINFWFIYGGSWYRLQSEAFDKADVVWSKQFCKDVRYGMEQEYAYLPPTIKENEEFVLKHGYVTTPIIGHVRWFPELKGVDPNSKSLSEAERALIRHNLREAWNHCIQSMDHDILEISMQRIYDFIKKEKLRWKLCNDLHDGFLCEVPNDEVKDAATYFKSVMETVPGEVLGEWLQVPLTVEIAVGTHFGDMKEIPLHEISMPPFNHVERKETSSTVVDTL